MAFLDFPHEVTSLIRQLDADMAPQWGRMNAQQMVEHCIVIMKVSIGAIPVKIQTPEQEWAKRKTFLFGQEPMPRNFQNPALPPDPRPLHYPDFETARQKLISTIEQFEVYWATTDQKAVAHPLFGPLHADEWRRFHQKHFTHHLAQFGLVA